MEEKQLFTDKGITDTLRENYMPYAMSVIISRAIPEIDGFKPSHRKLLYTMYKMGLLTGARTKSANVVGQTMRLNPHGDQAIYDTLVRLSRGYGALLYPFVDSKGNFGKHYSRDMAYAAARYTECKLDPFCQELFSDIDKDTIDFVDNYDGTMQEPTLLPVSFPNILVNANQGIAVGMASNICSFNLTEVCETAIELIKNPAHRISLTLKAPDFSTGGSIVLSHRDMERIYETGRGTFRIRAKYEYDKKRNSIDILEIPYTTSIENIMDKIAELIKAGRLREVADARDLTDLNGLKISLELRRGVDPDMVMQKLYKLTPLEDTFGCNFNVLVGGMPRVMGVREILDEWLAFRTECIKRRLYFDMTRKKQRLHLLKGLEKILLDIDKAIAIIRGTEEEAEVVPNLMIGFGIDELQAEFIADIRLRNLNRRYILNKVDETSQLAAEISDIEATLADKARFSQIIIDQLAEISKKYGRPRRSDIVFEDEIEEYVEQLHVEDYPVTLFLTRGGYLKKITPQSLRMSGEHKLKEGDAIVLERETTNKAELIIFTNKCQAYKARVYEFDDTKASAMGDYLPTKLHMEEGEFVLYMAVTCDYSEKLVIFYAEGKGIKTDLASFDTKTNRKKLKGAYSDKLTPVALFSFADEADFLLKSSNGRVLIVNSALMPYKAGRSGQGTMVMNLGKKCALQSAVSYEKGSLANEHHYRAKTLPAAGKFLKEEDAGQLQLL